MTPARMRVAARQPSKPWPAFKRLLSGKELIDLYPNETGKGNT